uniref:Actin-interacting protein 1 n=1 Tax=Hemiscolopendra marginata TaxID=943146 RepID=A0A646QD15_9MYRI
MSYRTKNIYATLPRTQRGVPIVLGGDPKGKNFLYTNGNSVIIRDIANPAISDVYTEHSTLTTVAKYSPSGFYIASGDQSGKIRIWDTTQKEHLLKNEYQPIAGTIKDIAWSADSQRMVAVGEGRERFGHVFMADTGTSVGEISGQSKAMNSCDFRHSRPFRIITASEDNTVAFFEGPPFKFKCTKQDHTRFVQAVRFSPDGERFASAGFDGKVFLYDGKSSDKIAELGSPAHKGGVYGVAWSPDNKQLLSVSGDKTCKLWDVGTTSVISEFVIGHEIDDQQVSCLWQGQFLLTVSLSGFITYLDVNNPSKPLRIIKGHNKSITSLSVTPDKSTLFTGSHDGYVSFWDVASGDCDRVMGRGHTNQVQDMAMNSAALYTCGMDDVVKSISTTTKNYLPWEVKMDSQPRGIAVSEGGLTIVAGICSITVLRDGVKQSSLIVDYEPTCVDINHKDMDVAVGGGLVNQDNKVHIYALTGNNLSHKLSLDHIGGVMDVKYSPDGQYLASSDTNRKIIISRLPGYEPAHKQEWGFHNARVNSVAWSPDSTLVASGGLDCAIIVWSLLQPSKHIIIKNAHPQSQITRVSWLDNNTIVSVGQDCNTKIWEVAFT